MKKYILLILLFYTTVGFSQTKTLGNTEVYTSITTSANRRAIPVTFTETSLIKSISIYHSGGKDSLLMGVYSDFNSGPGQLLGVTEKTIIDSNTGWRTLNLIEPVTVSIGQTVWLAYVFQTNPGIRFSVGPSRAESSETWPQKLPFLFGTSNIDNYKYSMYCTYTVLCNTHIPEFTFTISKPVVLGQKVGTGRGCDPNGDNIFWSIDENPEEWKIVIDPENVMRMYIVVNNPSLINNSTQTKYTMTVRISDDGKPITSFNLSKINIIDVNDPPVINTQSFSINENIANSTTVGKVIATDPNINQTLQYSIIDGNINNSFVILQDGDIIVSNLIDYESTPLFNLKIKVQDNGTGKLSAQNIVTINVNNLNEAPIVADQTF